MRPVLAILIAASLAQPASALSCMRPTVASSYGAAQQSPLTYSLATGRLSLLPGDASPVPRDVPGVTTARRARLDGHTASTTGFDQPISRPIQVETYCAGPWCGSVPEGDLLLFLEKRDEIYVLLEGPCPRFALPATPEAVTEALICLRGTSCDTP